MDQKLLARVLSQLSIKWKKRDSIVFDAAEDLDWLFDHGMIECGLDTIAHGMTCGESKQLFYIVSGQDWHTNTITQAMSDAAIRDKKIGVQITSQWAYLRLTPAGVEHKRSGLVDCDVASFRFEQVEYFEERLTAEELERFTEDEKLRIYMRQSIKDAYRKVDLKNLAFQVTREMVKHRVTLPEFARLGLGFSSEHIVVGQEHETIQRDLIAHLWPDLAELVELDGSVDAYTKASDRLRGWTGLPMPFCHRDWRALSEWAGLKPEEITDDWLDGFLVPRLRVLWLKKTTATISEPKTESESSTSTIHPATAEPPEAFCKDGHPIGPLTGNRTALGFALHDEDNLSEVAYRSQFATKVAKGTIWVRESTHSRILDMFVKSFPVRDKYQKRLEKFAERK